MKCEYCGAEYTKAKYSEGCKSCYGPAPEQKYPNPYGVNHNIKELKITQSPAVIMVGGAGGGGGAGYFVTGGEGGSGCIPALNNWSIGDPDERN